MKLKILFTTLLFSSLASANPFDNNSSSLPPATIDSYPNGTYLGIKVLI